MADAGAHTLTASRELIWNSSNNLKVTAMGCGYGLIPTMLTIPLMEKWQGARETGWLWHLICSAMLIPPQSHGLLNYSLVLLLCFIIPAPETHIHTHIHTHFIFHSHTDEWCKRRKKRNQGKSMMIVFFSTPKDDIFYNISFNFFKYLMKQLNQWGCLKAAVYSNTFLVMSVCNRASVITQLASQAAQWQPKRRWDQPASHQTGSG